MSVQGFLTKGPSFMFPSGLFLSGSTTTRFRLLFSGAAGGGSVWMTILAAIKMKNDVKIAQKGTTYTDTSWTK